MRPLTPSCASEYYGVRRLRMSSDKSRLSFAALFFPERGGGDFAMYLSEPQLSWLSDDDMTKVMICRTGMYCLFFLTVSRGEGKAWLSVNGRKIEGSYAQASKGRAVGSAVCSIHERALPCSIEINTEGGAENGVLLVVKCEV